MKIAESRYQNLRKFYNEIKSCNVYKWLDMWFYHVLWFSQLIILHCCNTKIFTVKFLRTKIFLRERCHFTYTCNQLKSNTSCQCTMQWTNSTSSLLWLSQRKEKTQKALSLSLKSTDPYIKRKISLHLISSLTFPCN